jgi:hypothetical protein
MKTRIFTTTNPYWLPNKDSHCKIYAESKGENPKRNIKKSANLDKPRQRSK